MQAKPLLGRLLLKVKLSEMRPSPAATLTLGKRRPPVREARNRAPKRSRQLCLPRQGNLRVLRLQRPWARRARSLVSLRKHAKPLSGRLSRLLKVRISGVPPPPVATMTLGGRHPPVRVARNRAPKRSRQLCLPRQGNLRVLKLQRPWVRRVQSLTLRESRWLPAQFVSASGKEPYPLTGFAAAAGSWRCAHCWSRHPREVRPG